MIRPFSNRLLGIDWEGRRQVLAVEYAQRESTLPALQSHPASDHLLPGAEKGIKAESMKIKDPSVLAILVARSLAAVADFC